jgi:hypothetical protein
MLVVNINNGMSAFSSSCNDAELHYLGELIEVLEGGYE